MNTYPPLKISEFLYYNTYTAWLWLVLRIYIGWLWLIAGYEKLFSPRWIGEEAGSAVSGFLMGALEKTSGAHPDVSAAYAWFISNIALPYAEIFSYLVVFGELLVGAALILGIFTGFSAFMGAFMNVNYLFAGTVSMNPIMLIIQVFLILAWRIAGLIGADRYLLPLVRKRAKS